MSNTKDTPMDYKQQPLSEKDEAIRMANKALDVPNADPDDDLRTISRHFLRSIEQNASLKLELQKQKEDRKSIDNPDHHIKVLKERLVELESQYQKQKELSAELVRGLKIIRRKASSTDVSISDLLSISALIESLIKKSSEI